ncbi:hypothetical protein DR79_681 [Francisella tularensis]|uniref:Uncharacterized protein n=1 Tax=Francisella tularensis TaxID=263 RepID=A0AAW3D3W2_FRATU|nr:hypothetical protein RO31_1822 [Francisella tularensis subsp. tularensis str. SCHU S4 substr. NR-28534]KFJ38715.1 hypothetical protein DR85_1269 [Francisella tularensis]KFJ40119.1 hypothetical protein DR87_75 [Francisella tularensis]KFJ45436.1 hypothetical protein DR79_681 [Francisella tularensis]KFJ61003.1 hypothetical protein DR80_1156 [Francisella tularensis]
MVMDISIQIKVYCLLGEIPNKTLSKYFFEIWLSDKSSHIKLSKQLRGL